MPSAPMSWGQPNSSGNTMLRSCAPRRSIAHHPHSGPTAAATMPSLSGIGRSATHSCPSLPARPVTHDRTGGQFSLPECLAERDTNDRPDDRVADDPDLAEGNVIDGW